jgi:hypothetical protein
VDAEIDPLLVKLLSIEELLDAKTPVTSPTASSLSAASGYSLL